MSSDKEILALEDRRYAAMCGGDFAALEAMLHDELLYTHSSGLTDTKATWSSVGWWMRLRGWGVSAGAAAMSGPQLHVTRRGRAQAAMDANRPTSLIFRRAASLRPRPARPCAGAQY
jgi:hypothetical protein